METVFDDMLLVETVFDEIGVSFIAINFNYRFFELQSKEKKIYERKQERGSLVDCFLLRNYGFLIVVAMVRWPCVPLTI